MPTKRREEPERIQIDYGIPPEEWREMWDHSHELQRREVEALERIAHLLGELSKR
jgi:hypothetical protein